MKCAYVRRLIRSRRVLLTALAVLVFILFITTCHNLRRPVIPEYKLLNKSRGGHEFSLAPRQEGIGSVNANAGLPEDIKRLLKDALEKANNKKKLLMWYQPWGKLYSPSINRENCGNCEIISDRAAIDDIDTAAVIFHWYHVKQVSMPSLRSRREDQLYVWWTGESPAMVPRLGRTTLDLEETYNFNATMTYRRDANIWRPYWSARILHRADEVRKYAEILSVKSRFALGLVSNCKITPGAEVRIQMFRLMIKDPKVEFYGKCFGERYTGSIDTYKFLLAFENSYHCRDYITEKLFEKALVRGLLPVVWGATKRDYEEFAPPESFIFAENFDNIDDLLKYMRYLDQNDTAYMEYFRWRLDENAHFLKTDRATSECSLCRMVHGINVDDMYPTKFTRTNLTGPLFTKGILRRTIPSLKRWFYGNEDEVCLNGPHKETMLGV